MVSLYHFYLTVKLPNDIFDYKKRNKVASHEISDICQFLIRCQKLTSILATTNWNQKTCRFPINEIINISDFWRVIVIDLVSKTVCWRSQLPKLLSSEMVFPVQRWSFKRNYSYDRKDYLTDKIPNVLWEEPNVDQFRFKIPREGIGCVQSSHRRGDIDF